MRHTIKTGPRSAEIGRCRTVKRYSDRSALITALRRSPQLPAAFVAGIEHRAAARILRAALPTVSHSRRSIHWSLDEHLFIDEATNSGVRVLAHWDERAGRANLTVAETGDRVLWDHIVIAFAEWERAGRPVPGDDADLPAMPFTA